MGNTCCATGRKRREHKKRRESLDAAAETIREKGKENRVRRQRHQEHYEASYSASASIRNSISSPPCCPPAAAAGSATPSGDSAPAGDSSGLSSTNGGGRWTGKDHSSPMLPHQNPEAFPESPKGDAAPAGEELVNASFNFEHLIKALEAEEKRAPGGSAAPKTTPLVTVSLEGNDAMAMEGQMHSSVIAPGVIGKLFAPATPRRESLTPRSPSLTPKVSQRNSCWSTSNATAAVPLAPLPDRLEAQASPRRGCHSPRSHSPTPLGSRMGSPKLSRMGSPKLSRMGSPKLSRMGSRRGSRVVSRSQTPSRVSFVVATSKTLQPHTPTPILAASTAEDPPIPKETSEWTDDGDDDEGPLQAPNYPSIDMDASGGSGEGNERFEEHDDGDGDDGALYLPHDPMELLSATRQTKAPNKNRLIGFNTRKPSTKVNITTRPVAADQLHHSPGRPRPRRQAPESPRSSLLLSP